MKFIYIENQLINASRISSIDLHKYGNNERGGIIWIYFFDEDEKNACYMFDDYNDACGVFGDIKKTLTT